DTVTSPSSGPPPLILSLSTGLPFRGREGTHRQRVDLLAHALPERRIDELVALHAAPAGERLRDDERLEVLPVSDHFQVLAGETALDPLLHAFRSHHLSASACSPTSGAPHRRKIRQPGSVSPPPGSPPAPRRKDRRNHSEIRRSCRRRGWRATA